MNEFAKQKIAFSVAFLAALFAISPLLPDMAQLGFSIFNIDFSIKRLYYVLAGILMLAVYVFGVQFLVEKGIGWAARIGNVLYATVFLVPVLYGVLWITVWLVGFIGHELSNGAISTITSSFSFVFGIITAVLVNKLQARLVASERSAAIRQYEREESLFLKRAEDLLRDKNYDLAVVEAYKAIEVSARKALLDHNRHFHPAKWIDEIKQLELLPAGSLNMLYIIRNARNSAAHGIKPTLASTAAVVVSAATQIVAVLISGKDEE